MSKFERLAPLTSLLPSAEHTTEAVGLKVGLTLLAIGTLLFFEAGRQRNMEAATKRTRLQSKAAMTILAAGMGTLLYFGVWK